MSTPSLIHSVQPDGDVSALSRNEIELIVLRRARNGDRVALTSLWDEYRRPLFRFFARAVSSREEAEDLTSETMLAVFNSLATFRGFASTSSAPTDEKATCRDKQAGPNSRTPDRVECTFSSFLFSIAHNQLRQWIRRKQVRDQRTLAASVSHSLNGIETQDGYVAEWHVSGVSADPLDSVLRREQLDSVCFALVDVGMRSCEQFKALLFHYACGLPHKDIAALLSTRKETINARLQEGRSTLKAHYASEPEG